MNFDEFAKKLHEDEDLREKFQAIDNFEDAHKLASENGLDASLEEFKSKMEQAVAASASLSDEDLALASGGNCDSDCLATDIITTITKVAESLCGTI